MVIKTGNKWKKTASRAQTSRHTERGREREGVAAEEDEKEAAASAGQQQAAYLNVKEIESLDVGDDDAIEALLHEHFLLVLFIESPREAPEVLPGGLRLCLSGHQQILASGAGEGVGDGLCESDL